MKRFLLLLLVNGAFSSLVQAQNQIPQVQNLQLSVDWIAKTLVVQYDVSDAENDPLEVAVDVSNNGGRSYNLSGSITTSGDVGFPVGVGVGKSILCNLSGIDPASGPFQVRLVVDDKQPVDIQLLVNAVDSVRLRNDLEFVEGIRHRTAGAVHLAAVRDSMKQLLASSYFHTAEHTFTYTGNYTGRNIVGSHPGTQAAGRVVVVDAHYDSVSNAPGADDNGSGTVGVWEIARILGNYPAKKTLRCIGFDLEEVGLVGSTRYVQNGIPATDTIDAVLNFEMIGYYSDAPNSQELPAGFNQLFPNAYNAVANNQWKGDFITNVGNVASSSLTTTFKNAAAQYVPDLRVISLDVPGNGQIAPDLRRSDHAPFWDSNRKALMITDGADFRNECYHTPGDTLNEKLNFTFMSNVVKATLATAAQLLELQHAAQVFGSFESQANALQTPAPCTPLVYRQPGSRSTVFLDMQDCNDRLYGIQLFDLQGRLVAQPLIGTPQVVYSLDIAAQAPGMYLVKCQFLKESRTIKLLID
jgi:hypothetical protein